MFNLDSLTVADLGRLNSVTKYPETPTYHSLNKLDGTLIDGDPQVLFDPSDGPVIVTEKVDGANARLICTPDGRWLIGSRDELLTADTDRVRNVALGIVNVFLDGDYPFWLIPDSWLGDKVIWTLYFEVYGGRIGKQWRQYTADPQARAALMFDASFLPVDLFQEMRSWPVENVAGWRDRGGQTFVEEQALTGLSFDTFLATSAEPIRPLVDRVSMDASQLPTGIEETARWLERFSDTRARITADGTGRSEGVVVRTEKRNKIAKIRREDYARTLRMKAAAS